jgi:hypothetical protein
MPRVLLLLPTATYRASDFLAAARALDAEVVVASERRQAMSETMGDRALVVDLRRPEAAASGVMMLPIPNAGVLKEVRGQAEARAVPGVTGLEISIARGKAVQALPEADRYLGFLFARGETPEQVERTLRTAHDQLEIVIDEPPE